MKNEQFLEYKNTDNANSVMDKLLEVNFNDLSLDETQRLISLIKGAEAPVLDEEKISRILERVLSQFPKDFESLRTDNNLEMKKNLLWSVLDYVSNFKEKNKQTDGTTLDRSFRALFNLAEKYPVGVYESMTRTHHLFEFVKPEIFYETLIEIQDSKKLEKMFSGHFFSQLEYNVTYLNTERYIDALISKINFKDSDSCLKSGRLMNFAAQLADYANSGSYSGNYDIGKKITEMLEKGAEDPNSIYLLSSKAEYMAKRIKDELPPLVHREEVFSPTENVVARYDGDILFINKKTEESNKKFDEYNLVSKELSTPPKELVDEAIANGQDFVEWTPSRELIMLQKKLALEINQDLRPINSNDLAPIQNFEISKNDIKEYSFLIGSDFRIFIEEEFGISLAKLNLKEQFYLFLYFQKQTNKSIKKTKEFSKKYKEAGLKTFFSIAYGGKEIGDKILELGERLELEVAEKVFAKYGEIIDTAESTGQILEKILPDRDVSSFQQEVEEIKNSLLLRAKNLLVNFYDKKEANSDELLKDLERYQAEILLYADTYKKLNQSGKEVKLEDIKGTDISILSQEEKEKMAENFWNITKANRPFIKDEEKIEKRKKEFTESIQNKESNFYVLRHNDKVIAFCSFTPGKDGNLYVESLNIESEVKGAQIGSEFFPAVLEKVKKLGRDIYGYVHEKNKSTLPYYERLGFEIKEVQKDGELKYEIRIPAEKIELSKKETKLAA